MEKENFKLETTRVYIINGSLVAGKCIEEAIAVYRMTQEGGFVKKVELVDGFDNVLTRTPVFWLDSTVQEVKLSKKKDFELVENAVADVDGNVYNSVRING